LFKKYRKKCAVDNLRGSQRRAIADSRAESQAHKQECNAKPYQYSTIYRVKPSVASSLALICCHVGLALGHEYHILIRSVIAS
jgi:hypothetical protein